MDDNEPEAWEVQPQQEPEPEPQTVDTPSQPEPEPDGEPQTVDDSSQPTPEPDPVPQTVDPEPEVWGVQPQPEPEPEPQTVDTFPQPVPEPEPEPQTVDTFPQPVPEPDPEPQTVDTPSRPEPEPDGEPQTVEEQSQPQPMANTTPQQGDPSHIFVGTDSRGDVWQLFDGTNVIEWAVNPGDDSRNLIDGTVANLGAPSNMSVAQPANIPAMAAPGAITTNPPPPAVIPPPAGDSRHHYVGTDARGDIWQLFDGTNVIEWAVKVNDDSRNIIPGSARNLGAPSSATTAQNDGLPVQPPAAPPVRTTAIVPTSVPGAVTLNPQPVQPRANILPTPSPTAVQPRQGDARHKYVGRDNRGDVWQLFDGTNIIEWAVRPGDDSRNMIPGSARNLGAPSNMTVAQDDGTPVQPPQTYTPTVSNPSSEQQKSATTVLLGIAGLLVSVLK